MSRLVCVGCGARPGEREPWPFRCPNAGVGDVDHVLRRVLDLDRVRFPDDGDDEPFIRYRDLLHSHHRALAGGMTDGGFVALVRDLDAAVAAVDGHGFRVTPYGRDSVLSDHLGFTAGGGVWVKDETGNVAGSHKARHLMGVALHLDVAERIGLADRACRPDLAVASCGNAALAAAVVARAACRRLRVFVPVDADEAIVARLHDLDADVVECRRVRGVPGDPTYARLREALAAGALPFTCQGSENGLVIEGGETLGYELESSGIDVDHVVVQVGGGALASALCQSLDEAVALGALPRVPRIHTVQTESVHPLERAYRRVRAHGDDLCFAARHRSAFMRPWEGKPCSIATGILDDETYDWLAVVGAMLATDGRPVVVGEARLAAAHDLGHAAGYAVSATGAAGLAGLLALRAVGTVRSDERVAVLFTGVDR